MDSKMDPIAFFDHLAANSISSRSSHGANGEESSESCSSINDQDSYVKHHQHLNTTTSRFLETVKLGIIPPPIIAENQALEHHNKDMNGFQDRWNNLIQTYRIEKEALGEHLKEQLITLAQVEQQYNKANMDLYQKVENSYHQLQTDLTNHQYHINTEKRQFEREKDLIREVRKIQDQKIKLNVGGQLFETSLATLRKDPNSMLAQMFNENSSLTPDADNSYFIDRDSTYFRLVLNYLRDLRIPLGIVEDAKIMDELMQEARFYKLNDLLKLKWDNLPVITQEQLYQLYPPPSSNHNTPYRPIIMQLAKKNLSNLDFSNYHIDPQSTFSESNLENAQFVDAKFGFDFDYRVDFCNAFLVGTSFPKQGTTNRASGVEFKLDGAILNDW